MPMKVNIGLNRKVGDSNYGSRGASVNLELELDSSLVQEPAKLQEKIRQVFNLVRTSLHEELNGTNGPAPTNGNAGGQASKPRPATQSQVKALHSIAKEHGVNLAQFLRDRFQARKPEDLSIKQASEAIDLLKSSNNGE